MGQARGAQLHAYMEFKHLIPNRRAFTAFIVVQQNSMNGQVGSVAADQDFCFLLNRSSAERSLPSLSWPHPL